MKKTILLILVSLGAFGLGILAREVWMGDSPQIEPLPQPVLLDLEGQSHRLEEWSGKVVVLNFWATWCAPCREEMPEFSKIQDELAPRGLQVIGVAIDDAAEVEGYLKSFPVHYPILIGDDAAPKWAESLGDSLSVLPFTVVLDRKGRPVARHIGIFHREELLKAVEPLLN